MGSIENFSLKPKIFQLIPFYKDKTMLLNIRAVIISIFHVVVMSTPLPTTPSTCQEPANLDEMWNKLQAEYGKNVLERIPHEVSNLKQSYINGQLVMGETTCPNNLLELKTSADASLYQRSTCPYYYVMEVNEKRYPRATTEVRCRCNGCLEKTGRSDYQSCEPIKLPMKMLRNTGVCNNGVWQYEPYTHELPVACTCAVRREHVSSVQLTSPPTSPDHKPPPGM